MAEHSAEQVRSGKQLAKLSLPDLKSALKTTGQGLTQDEARERLGTYGYNEIVEKKRSPFLQFFSYFWGPIPWMIEAAVILSAIVKDWTDFFIILTLLFANACVGFWEEFQAGNTVEALKSKLALKAKARRDGAWTDMPARELTPGDVIRIRIGDIVPADVRLMGDESVEVDQSALTGESLPVERTGADPIYSGSIMKRGESDALVYAIGKDTYFGSTAQLVQEAHTVSHFQRAVLRIGDYLIGMAIVLVVLILAVALFRGERMLKTLEFVLILTVCAIPVALPTILSVTMAVGAKLLAGKQAVVTKLASIEELAGINVLCSDKTGTLTQNKLTLGDPFVMEGIKSEDLILNAALASREEDEDTIDLTVLGGIKNKEQLRSFRIAHFMPFDPVQKRTEATVQDRNKKEFTVTKGAPQVILALAANHDAIKEQVEKQIAEFASRGFRSLGVARREGPGQWVFLGIIPLFDPPREDSRETIKTAKEMGIRVKMLTGDQLAIAKEVARQLDLGSNIIDAAGFETVKHYETGQLAESIKTADGFAQVFPEHKFHIVEALQKMGDMVGMTGDGVNDAPALKKADVGIAVSGSTDAARAASDIVLMAPGLSVIIDAVKESRKIFQRMDNYATYRIAETIRVLLLMTLAILAFNFYPVTAVMIVLLALLNDGAILSIAFDRVPYASHPEKWNMPVVLGLASALGVAGLIASFGLFYIGERVFHLSRDFIQTLMYLKLSVAGHLTIFVTRTRGPFWSYSPAPILLAAVIGTQFIATLMAIFGIFMTPIGVQWALFVWGYAFIWFLFNDRVKLLALRIFDRQQISLLSKRVRKQ